MASKYLTDTRSDEQVGSFGFSMETSQGSENYIVENPTAAEILQIPSDILGGVDLSPRSYPTGPISPGNIPYGGIRRKLPRRSAQWENMYANGINNLKGTGGDDNQYELVNAVPSAFTPVISDKYAKYENYWVQVSFSNRNYDVLDDTQISTKTDTLFDTDGTEKSFVYPEEWNRYFGQPKEAFLNEFASAQQGQMTFRTASGDKPEKTPFQDNPRMLLPDSAVTFDWYQVPYDYWLNRKSFLRRCVGMVNQKKWLDYEPGELLYLGTDVQDYTPPVQKRRGQIFGASLGVNQKRLCNLTLKFKLTTRAGTDAPVAGGAQAPNQNWIVAGHNLLPWLTTRKYYYSTSFDPANPADSSKWVPTYKSFPVQLLFADPNYPQPATYILQP